MPPRNPPDPLSSMWAWIAYDLRFYRTRAGMSGEEFGRIMGVVRSTVSRMESGEYKIKEPHARALDRHFKTGGHFSRLLWYAQIGHNPDWFKTQIEKERLASVIKVFEMMVVPGLLQTPAYATTLFSAGVHTDDTVAQRVEERMARQEIFRRQPPPLLWAIMCECVLHQLIGGPQVMKEQLAHLLDLSELPNMAIRIVPRSSGAHIGMDGSFTVMSTDAGDVAYAEAPGGGRLIATADEVRKFSLWYDLIGQHALPENLSRDLIRQAMEDL